MESLNTCDGLLLLWGYAQDAWFQKYLQQLVDASGFREGGRPVDSVVILVKPRDERKTGYAKSLFPNGPLWEGIDLSKLASFLITVTTHRRHVDIRS
jgi:hypothetical protein